MNLPPTRDLDQFESALLTELRTHVAEHPAYETVPTPITRHRHRARWAAGLAVAAAAATAFVVASPGGPATSPAYAVDQTGDGDVVVTIHRLEDSAGLEEALREHGIDADVSFTRDNTFEVSDGELLHEAPPEGAPDYGTNEVKPDSGMDGLEEGGGSHSQAEPAIPNEMPADHDCGWDHGDPATLTHVGDDWVLRIPAKSPLQDRPVQISTGPDGELFAAYAGNEPNSYCGVMSVGA